LKPSTKIRKNKNENHSFKIGTPEGKRRIRASLPIPNLREYTPKYSDLGPLSRSIRRANPRWKRGK
jgi:hypothetical protein